ncbi:borealin isoform X1 [Falco cherrug]|uniref:borealin isoform X1 n=2 Tax=Falco TaxID=8952 RepID=UPI0024793758|nr:borealin isoform X1 [Falco cherrug]
MATRRPGSAPWGRVIAPRRALIGRAAAAVGFKRAAGAGAAGLGRWPAAPLSPAMAPSRKKAGASTRAKKLAAFLKDFDREVKVRLDRLRVNGERLVREVENLYEMEILRLPPAHRDMNWLEYFAKGGGEKVLEEAVTADLEITEINKLTAEALSTPLKIFKKVEKSKQVIEAIEEEVDPPLLPLAKKARHDSQCLPGLEAENINPRAGKMKASTKKVPGSRSRRPPSTRVKRMSKRSSKNNFITPVNGRIVDISARGGTSMITPRFDSRIFKTPGLRTPAVNERVYTISANGSPLANSNDIFITVPVGGGESICLTASDLTKKNILHLNPEAQGIMKKLSVRLAQACSDAKKPTNLIQ